MANRGDVYLADLDSQKGSEQSGMRPVVIVQTDILNRVGNTVVIVPFTTNLRRKHLPSSVFVQKGEGGLTEDSVALCHQIRVLDKSGLIKHLGTISNQIMSDIENKTRFTLGI